MEAHFLHTNQRWLGWLPLLTGLLLSLNIVAQTTPKAVTGRIIESPSNQAVPGANVVIKGTATGTQTDADGNYTLNVPSGNETLVISFIGYVSQDVAIGNRSIINVTLAPDAQSLNEVVVTALGIAKSDRKLGYSVTTVKSTEIERTNTINPITALQGKVAGVNVNVMGASGVQTSPSIQIRGATSLTKNNQPIFVIDGIVLENNVTGADNGTDYGSQLKNLNPDNYESITVLKGAAATSVYGSRGINGAIVITSKKGTRNQGLGIEFNSTYQTTTPYENSIPLQNEYGAGNIFREGHFRPNNTNTTTSISFGPRFDGRQIPAIYNPSIMEPYIAQPDNWRTFFQTGNFINNSIALSGGSDKFTYRLAYTNTQNKGTLVNNSLKRNAVDFKTTGQLNNVFSIEMGINYAGSATTNGFAQGRYDWPGGTNVGFMTYYAVPRNANLDAWRQDYRNPDGSLRSYGYSLWDNQVNSLFNRFDNRNQVRNENSLLANLTLKAQVTPWLDLSARGNYNFYKIQTETQERGSGAGGKGGSFGQDGSYKGNYNALFSAHAVKQVSPDLNIDFRVLSEIYGNSFQENYSRSTRGGLIVPNQFVLGNSVLNTINPGNIDYGFARPSSRVYGLAGLLNLNYKDYLNVEITGRNDWVSSLTYPAGFVGENNYSVFYPSTNVAYSFFDHLKPTTNWLSSGRLRASLAFVGSGTDPYATSFQGYLPNVVFDQNGNSIPTSSLQNASVRPNTNLKPEIQRAIELGTNLGFLKDRIILDFAYYRTNTFNQILTLPGVSETGYNDVRINAGNIQNEGIEVLLNASPIKTNKLTWDVSMNFTRNRGKIVKFAEGITQYALMNNYDGASVYAYEGGAFGVMTAEANGNGAYASLDEKTGLPLLRANPRAVSTDPDTKYSVPSYSYVYQQTPEARYPIGNVQPTFLAGFNTSLRYKNWSLYAQIDSRVGGKVYSESYNYGMGRGTPLASLKYRDQANGGVSRTDSYTEEKVYDGVIPDAVFDKGQKSPITGADISGLTFRQAFDQGLVEPWKAINYYQNTYGFGTNLNFNGSVTDNTWVMLREITVSYRLPQTLLNRIRVKDASLRFTGRNIVYLYNGLNAGQNPESINGNNPLQPVITGGVPFTRNLSASINLSF